MIFQSNCILSFHHPPFHVHIIVIGAIEATSEISVARTLTDMTLTAESQETIIAKSGEILREESEETSPTKSKETLTAERSNEEEFAKIWPIGTPWEHSGIEEEDDSEPFEVRALLVSLKITGA